MLSKDYELFFFSLLFVVGDWKNRCGRGDECEYECYDLYFDLLCCDYLVLRDMLRLKGLKVSSSRLSIQAQFIALCVM